MENFDKKIDESKKKIYVADHMLSNTYNLLKDSKILLATLQNIYEAFALALSGFLEHERMFKRISHYNPERESELNFFKLKVYHKYDFDEKYIKTIDKIVDTLRAQKDSPIEFTRNQNYIIASDAYDIKKISAEDLKKDIKTCKDFIFEVDTKIRMD